MTVADGYDVDTQTLRQAGNDLVAAAEQLDSAWQSLLGQAQGMGDIFGDDAVGGLIGASYTAAQDIADRSYLSVLRGFAAFAQGLAVMADTYDGAEATNTDLFTGMSG
jgi:hypothetical protein